MPRFYSDDPVRDFDRYDMAMAQREARLPQCENKGCRHPRIQDDMFFDIEGEILCEACMRDRYGRSTEDFLRDHYG